MTIEELAETYPGLVESLAAHPGIGAMLIRSEGHGAVVVGAAGVRYLDEDRVEGEDPTRTSAPRTIMSLKREDAMSHVPDLLARQPVRPDLPARSRRSRSSSARTAASADRRREPFILHPAEWKLDEDLVGAEAVYRQLRRWAERHLDHRFGKDGSAEPLPTPERPAAPAPVTADSALGG